MNTAASSSNDLNGRQSLELRSRCSKNLLNRLDNDSPVNGTFPLNGRVFINHQIKPTDTLNSIALQYSVQVAEIKRVNGLVADQEIFALKYIRVPIPQHSSYLVNNATTSTSSAVIISTLGENMSYETAPAVATSFPSNDYAISSFSHRHALTNGGNHSAGIDTGKVLQDYNNSSVGSSDEFDDNDSEAEFLTTDSQYGNALIGKKKRKKTIKNLLEKADATVAAVRENLSERSPNLEPGRFHFIDATAPDNTSKGVWLLVLSVVFMFVVVPLVLTLMEERSEEEQVLQHGNNLQRHHSHQGDVSV